MTTMTAAGTVHEVDATTLSRWVDAGEAMLVDVRPAEMFAAERIPGAISVPLPVLARPTLPDPGTRKLVFHCEVGVASEKAGQKMREAGWPGDVYHLPGGIRAWKRAGLPVERAAGGGLSIPRQVQIGAGSMVVLSVILGATVSPRFFALAGFVGAGLVFAGATGTCGMAAVLARLPYNRRNLNV